MVITSYLAANAIILPMSGWLSVRLGTPLNVALHETQSGFLQLTGDPVAARRMALQSLERLRRQQSSALAYFDSFVVSAALGVALAVLVLLMKRSVAAKGAHVAAE